MNLFFAFVLVHHHYSQNKPKSNLLNVIDQWNGDSHAHDQLSLWTYIYFRKRNSRRGSRRHSRPLQERINMRNRRCKSLGRANEDGVTATSNCSPLLFATLHVKMPSKRQHEVFKLRNNNSSKIAQILWAQSPSQHKNCVQYNFYDTKMLKILMWIVSNSPLLQHWQRG